MTSKDNREQLEAIFKDYNRLVSSVCHRMIQDSEIAEDAAQEVWIEIVKSIESFRSESKLSTWIYTIAYRVVKKFSKNEKKYSTRYLKEYFHGEKREIPNNIDYDEKLWIKEMCDKCLTGILHCLTNEARIVYIFREITELEYAEISEITGRDEASIRKLISRSRNKLKNFLKDECALYNPSGKCKCRMSELVLDINLPDEYKKLRESVGRVNLYKESEKVLPKIEYWKSVL